ncbi:MAG: PCMD domain-containing protein [Muribaculaceae bacterium]|nr:PCMD domain-containing protein [Muribaculaceae bacterium]
MKNHALRYSCRLLSALVVFSFSLASCIKDDIPYPRIKQMILEIAAEGESKPAYIDSLAFEAHIYLEETTDIQAVKFTNYRVSPDGVSDPNLLEGTYNMTNPLFVTISRYQEYGWEVFAHQDIVRYFKVAGEIGESVVDVAAHRVVVNMAEGTDLSRLDLEAVKLGPEGITTMVPDIKPGIIDLSYPLRVEVTAHGRTEVWTIYAEITETIVSTSQVDAWSKVIWASGIGPADVENGFEYRPASQTEWIPVPQKYVTQNQGSFSCYIPHLEPLTEYVVRTVSGENTGNEVRVTTQATADIPNGDFNQWSQEVFSLNKAMMWVPWNENGERYWDTGNRGSITLKVNLTTPTDYVPAGTTGKAARCETKFVGLGLLGKLASGSIYTGTYVRTDGTNGVLDFGRPWTLRPTKLRGYFQYQAATIENASAEFAELKGRPDTCHIYVALADWTEPFNVRTNPDNRNLFNKDSKSIIAYGELLYSGNMTEYKPFEIELEYRDKSRIPTYLQITCSASKYGDYFTGGAGSLLYVDQFSFDWDY